MRSAIDPKLVDAGCKGVSHRDHRGHSSQEELGCYWLCKMSSHRSLVRDPKNKLQWVLAPRKTSRARTKEEEKLEVASAAKDASGLKNAKMRVKRWQREA